MTGRLRGREASGEHACPLQCLPVQQPANAHARARINSCFLQICGLCKCVCGGKSVCNSAHHRPEGGAAAPDACSHACTASLLVLSADKGQMFCLTSLAEGAVGMPGLLPRVIWHLNVVRRLLVARFPADISWSMGRRRALLGRCRLAEARRAGYRAFRRCGMFTSHFRAPQVEAKPAVPRDEHAAPRPPSAAVSMRKCGPPCKCCHLDVSWMLAI